MMLSLEVVVFKTRYP